MLFGEVYQDVTSLDANRIRGDAQIRNEGAGSGRGIELPSVPRAGYDGSVERALAERPAVMRADAVDGADVTGYVAESVEVGAVDDFEERADGQLVEACEFFVRHCGVIFQFKAERGLSYDASAGR